MRTWLRLSVPATESVPDGRHQRGVTTDAGIGLVAAVGSGVALLRAEADVADHRVAAREGADAVCPARGQRRTGYDPVARVEVADHAIIGTDGGGDRRTARRGSDRQAAAGAAGRAGVGIDRAMRADRIPG